MKHGEGAGGTVTSFAPADERNVLYAKGQRFLVVTPLWLSL